MDRRNTNYSGDPTAIVTTPVHLPQYWMHENVLDLLLDHALDPVPYYDRCVQLQRMSFCNIYYIMIASLMGRVLVKIGNEAWK